MSEPPIASLGDLDLGSMPRALSRLAVLAWRAPLRSSIALLSGLAATMLNLAIPRLLGSAVDDAHRFVLEGGDAAAASHVLVVTAVLVAAAATGRGLLTGLQGYLGEYVAQRVGYDLRLAYFDRLQRLSFTFHDRVHSGELITRGMLDLEGVRVFVESGALRAITLVLLVAIGAWRVIGADPLTGTLALSFIPFVVWRAARMGALLRLSWMRLQGLMGDLTRVMEEALQGARVVRAFCGKAYELSKFDEITSIALPLSNQRILFRTGSVASMNLAYYAAMGAVLLVGAHRVSTHEMTVGALTEVLTFMTILQMPVRQVGMIVNSSARAASCGKRLFEILDMEPDIVDAPGASDLRVTAGVLRFESVSFSYNSTKPVLQDISFEVSPGRTLGIVGPPGSGKSSIAQLIPRFYDVTRGRVTIDGQDIRNVTLSSLRRSVALVQQDVFLFDASIRDNMAYADPDAETDSVVEAAHIAQIHEHVAGLPEGYGTEIGERGVALSGGQRQRLSITRGLVAQPAFFIFDDSTAAIDAVTERELRKALRGAVSDRATIIIAHRLSSLRHADEIIVLEEGRIVERGDHDSLLELDGAYASLWRLQNGAVTLDEVP